MDAIERALLRALLNYHDFLGESEYEDVTPELITTQYEGLAAIFAELDDAQRADLRTRFDAALARPGTHDRTVQDDFLTRTGLNR